MAHESTHVVQQRAAPIQRRPALSSVPSKVQRLLGGIGDRLNEYARHVPGYTLLTVVIGFNPLTGDAVERNATNLLAGLLGLVPAGTFIFDKLQEHGILQSAFEWVEGELSRLDLSVSRLERTIEEAWEDVRFIEGFDYNRGVLERHFDRLLVDVTTFALSLVDRIMQLIKEAAIGLAEELLAENRAWALLKKILRYDPLRGEPVDASTVEILEDFLLLIGKEQELEQMRERGALERTAAWLDTQLGAFRGLLAELTGLFTAAWAAIQPENLPDLAANLRSLADRAAGFLQRVWDFAVTVATTVLQLIKDALLSWLSSFATDVPGYHLVTVILGRDVFTREPVPRTPTNLIRGFLSLIPGGERQFQEMSETGVIPEAAQRIETLLSELGISWAFVQELFLGIWSSLTIGDLIHPIDAFQRIMNRFGEPIGRLFAFVRQVITIILELVLQIMGFPSDILGRIITNALQAFEDIKRDPIGFFKNMLSAVKLGFGNFFDNILTHLLSGVTDWLFGTLRKAGIEPPSQITLESILDLVLQILGITVDRLWEKLADRIGQERVDRIRGAIDRLVGIWTFVRDVQQRGIAAIWEAIESRISNLWDMVLEQARDWIVTRVIDRVVTKLLSMLDPTGIMAVVNSFLAFFNAVQSAIEYFREMLLIVDDYVTTIASVARGEVEPGAAKMEQGLARSIPVAIGFLANQVGLGNLADKIQEIVAGIRGVVDRALDWLMDRAVAVGQGLLRTLGLGETGEGEPAESSEDEAGLIRTPFSMEGVPHEIHIRPGASASVGMSSPDAGSMSKKIRTAIGKLRQQDPEPKERIARLRAIEAEAEAAKTMIADPSAPRGQIDAATRALIRAIIKYGEDFEAQDIAGVLANEFPSPDAGPYGEMAAEGKAEPKLPDGRSRAAHHAPPVVLAVVLSKALKNAGLALEQENKPEAAEPLIDAGDKLAAAQEGHGRDLPAILVHSQTHTERGGPGARIHGREIKEPLEQRLDQENIPELQRIRTTKGTLVVKPGQKAYERQLTTVARTKDRRIRQVKSAVKRHGPAITKTVYEGAAAQSLSAVDVAVMDSALDGPDDEKKKDALKKLRELADSKWKQDLLSSIFD